MDKFYSMTAFGFYGIALLGILAHAVKKWAYREISYSVFDYLFIVDPRSTVVVVGMAIGGVLTGIATGTMTNLQDAAQVLATFTGAFALDSGILPATTGAGVGANKS